MKDSLIGNFVVSEAGHDKGKIYLIIAEEGKYLYVTDGRYHPLTKLKKKNRKHVQLLPEKAEEPIYSLLCNKDKIFDHEVRYAIKRVIRKEEGHV